MATLLTQVDRTQGNYQQVFIYTINSGFSGITGDINSAQIRIFFPDILNVYLGDIQDPVKNVIEEAVENGTLYTFDFESIEDLGISVRIGLGITFKLEAENEATYVFTPEMWINGEKYMEYESEPVQLVAIPAFEISRELILPKIAPAQGGAVFYKVTMQNFGDLGAKIENVEINCNGTENLIIDPDYAIYGRDASSADFEDKSQDDTLATVENNIINFQLPSYRGEKYEFIYRAVIGENVQVGDNVTSQIDWIIDEEEQTPEFDEFTLIQPQHSGMISIYGPDYTLPSEYICYMLSIENNGNQKLENMYFANDLPQDVNYYELSTGAFNIGAIDQDLNVEYIIEYETVNGQTGTLGPFNTDTGSIVNLNGVVGQGDNILNLKWNLQEFDVGMVSKSSPRLKGIVKGDVPFNTSILNSMTLQWVDGNNVGTVDTNQTAIVDEMCVLRPNLYSSVPSGIPVRPNETIRYTLGANCINSRLKNPLLAILLPKELKYVGNVSPSYSDIFGNISPPTPQAVVIENFTENGETLVKFEFKGQYAYSFRQMANIGISFDTVVAVGAKGSISDFSILNTIGSTGVIPQFVGAYTDERNIAQDISVGTTYAKSQPITNNILFFVSITSKKKVKGMLDNDFVERPQLGRTVEGGTVDYQISIKNIGNADLNKIEVVDIIPYTGDIHVVNTANPRNSQYNMYPISEVVAKILPLEEEVEFEILYSKSIDPVRFGPQFNIIGAVNDWQTEAPEDLSQVKAFKVITKDITLLPGQTFEIYMKASIPVGVPTSQIAWNSFAADVIYTDTNNVQQHLLAVEPEKIGLQVVAPTAGTGQIGGMVWRDIKLEGLYEASPDALTNDVGVVLYREDGTVERITFTAPNTAGLPGQYLFTNLPIGRYYVKFFIEDDKFKFTSKRTDKENGSKVNVNTGLTSIIDLNLNPIARDIDMGFIDIRRFRIDEIMKVNTGARSMMRNVIYNQMLISMKQEDLLELIDNPGK